MLTHTVEDNILIAAFNNGKYNAINYETIRQLSDAVKKVNSDDSIKGLILTGTGKIYSSGFDLGMFLGFTTIDEAAAFFDEADAAFLELFMCTKPVVCAMNGASMAGGLIVSMAADYRICSNHPKIQLGMSEIKLGLGMNAVQVALMNYGLGSVKNFRNVIYNAERFNPEGALNASLVDEICDGADLMKRAKEVVVSWYDNPGKAFNLLKYPLRKPVFDQIQSNRQADNWRERLKGLFHPETQAALKAVYKSMQ